MYKRIGTNNLPQNVKEVILGADSRQRENKKPNANELKKYMFKGKIKDTTQYFRKIREAEA